MKNIIIHLRLPFSLFLMPVYWFALSQSESPQPNRALWIFAILHLLIYPASNAYNSYFDKDKGPIGGLAHPPAVSKGLYYTALGIDFMAFLLSYFFINTFFAVAILIYGLISKAYSHPMIRLKKYPFFSWLIVGIFQGAFVYLAIIQTLDNLSINQLLQTKYLLPATLASLNLLAFYPMTQIYQHQEDASRGDLTLSRKLGINGTFIFTAILFMLATFGYYFYFQDQTINQTPTFFLYLITTTPALLFFCVWFFITIKNQEKANFINTMILNLLGSLCLNLFFVLIYFAK